MEVGETVTALTESSVPDGIPRLPRMTAQGAELDRSATALGPLRRSGDAVDDPAELNRRLDEDGYLYLPGYLDRPAVLDARRAVLAGLAPLGALAPGSDPGVAAAAAPFPELGILNDLARDCEPLRTVLYGPGMTGFYERLFGEAVRSYDFTWLRAIPPGPGTRPHGDSVFMNRGTDRQLTAWVPLGDVDVTLGGLVVLEGSHRLGEIRRTYGNRDVDTFCLDPGSGGPRWDGTISDDPRALREQLGLRWVTGDYRAGDLLTFTTHTLHASLDNNTDRVRLSSDSRYQRAAEPADPRWVGPSPSAHGAQSQRGVVC